MAGKKKKAIKNLVMKVILLSVLAVTMILCYSRTVYAEPSDDSSTAITNSATLLDPFSLDDLVITMEADRDPWYQPHWHHRHRYLRSPYKPPFPD